MAGGAAGDDVHRLDLSPVDFRYVAEVGDVGVVVLEDSGGGFVELAVPGDFRAWEDVLDCDVKSAVAAEKASYFHVYRPVLPWPLSPRSVVSRLSTCSS